jgi:hypothetical protein
MSHMSRCSRRAPSTDGRRARSSRRCAALLFAATLAGAATATAQGPLESLQQRGQGASNALIQVVQQGISALPPIGPQAYSYEFDPALGAMRRSELPGSTVFRVPNVLPAQAWSLRVAGAYFDIEDEVTAGYAAERCVEQGDPATCPRTREGFIALGFGASARVGIISLAASYGLTDFIELDVALPITIVDAEATDIVTTASPTSSQIGFANTDLNIFPVETREDLDTIRRGGTAPNPGGSQVRELGLARVPYDTRESQLGQLGASDSDLFNSGTGVGLGRASIAAKIASPRWNDFRFALAPEVLLPSPSEDEYAGPDSAALAMRVLGVYEPDPHIRLLVDLGYEWDTESTSLTRFAWAGGVSFPTEFATVDLGVTGSRYQNGVRWGVPGYEERSVQGAFRDSATLLEGESITLDNVFVNFAFGIKVPLSDRFALSGSALVPVDDASFRPDAYGTLGFEAYF